MTTRTSSDTSKKASKKTGNKASSKRSGAKKSATKAVKPASTKSASAKAARKPSGAAAQRQSVKLEEDRANYLAKIAANEARLQTNEAANGKTLTPEQTKATQDILARQREHLAALDESRSTQ